MINIHGMVACGKRGGPTYLETVRVDTVTLSCPRGYVPCSEFTIPSDTICIEPERKKPDCPIIDMFLVKESAMNLWKDSFEFTAKNFGNFSDKDKTRLAYSKTHTRNKVVNNGEPVIDTVINT